MKKKFLAGLAMGLFMFSNVGPVCATLLGPIFVPNASFESPDVADGTAVASVSGWTFNLGGGFTSASAGIHDQLDAQYLGATGNNAPLPGSADGGQNAFLHIGLGSSSSFGQLTVSGLATVNANTQYLLTVALGNRLDADPGDISLALTVNDVSVNSSVIQSNLVPNGTFADFMVSFTTLPIGDTNVGGSLGILLSMNAPSGTGQQFQANFDNIRLTTNAVPEPSTITLMSIGSIGIFLYGWRRSLSVRRMGKTV